MKGTVDEIRHIGSVNRITGNTLLVNMLQSSACAGCHAAKLCQSSESKEKEVEVVVSDGNAYQLGEKVLLVGSVNQGLKATVWAYMIPIVLLVAVLFACVKAGLSDAVAALVSLGALVPYFVGLWLVREKFRTMFQFSVRKLAPGE